ncbi:MAG: glycogen synthase GlgA [Burkholderiales bacterium]|nr:glycogen synthase GlgA [Burkholderiales bacterium]
MPRILFAASECAPWVKTGGLGDVAEALPAALAHLGLEIRTLLPGYREVLAATRAAAELARLEPCGEMPGARLLAARLPSGVSALVLDAPALYDREGGPYLDAHDLDWPDNALRFGLLCRAAARIAAAGLLPDFRPDVLHINDWQTGLAAAYLHYAGAGTQGEPAASPGAAARSTAARPRVVFTVHNLAFQGLFPAQALPGLGLPQEALSPQALEFHGRLSFMKAGLQFADAITTVSPGYAAEIRSEPLGCGLAGLLEQRASRLYGILNGIDDVTWNPATDPHIAARYDRDRLEAKARNKEALQARLGLAADPTLPLLGFVGRLAWQKGIDLLVEAAPRLAALPAQLAVLGSGDREIEIELRAIAARWPGRVAVAHGLDEALAHQIEAGADLFLMPSRYEPCGLNQMYSQRYGTPPVARATGGHADNIVDCTPEALRSGSATGFLFQEISAEALFAAVERACAAWRDPAAWRALQRNGMARDFGWSASAARYARLYEELLRAPR